MDVSGIRDEFYSQPVDHVLGRIQTEVTDGSIAVHLSEGGSVDVRECRAEPAVAADGAGIPVLRGMQSLSPAPLLNSVVRQS